MKQLTLSGEAVSHDVCHGVDLGSGVHDVELLGVGVGLHDGLREKGIMPGTHIDTRAHTHTHIQVYILRLLYCVSFPVLPKADCCG